MPARGTSTIEADVRIKMCIDVTEEDFTTIHHELGHNFYERAYRKQPFIFRDSANDGFHEAIGDTIALSVTPEYREDRLPDKAPDAIADIGLLEHGAGEGRVPAVRAADRSVALEGVLRRGDARRAYNKAWWDLRQKYQGVAPPSPQRGDFDPGAKYHVPANTPYTRYFLADILQFQFHRALSQTAGCTTPLHRCSIFESKEAGQRLNAMLSMGHVETVAGRARGADAARDRWTRPRSSTTSRPCRHGSTSSSRENPSAGEGASRLVQRSSMPSCHMTKIR